VTGRPASGGAAQRESAPLGLSTMFVRTEAEPEAARAADPAASAAEDEHTYCTRCGQRLAPNHRFCGWCGHHID
ncbi:MAG: hypothetical protein ACRDWY_12495, partial [Actinomycetes bacterium]